MRSPFLVSLGRFSPNLRNFALTGHTDESPVNFQAITAATRTRSWAPRSTSTARRTTATKAARPSRSTRCPFWVQTEDLFASQYIGAHVASQVGVYASKKNLTNPSFYASIFFFSGVNWIILICLLSFSQYICTIVYRKTKSTQFL
jgi:hypothetical protein